jgi:DNA-binding transcriptional ArsR family regulator
LIDRLYKEIQDRLDQVLAEADRLRKALAALDPRGGSSSAPKARAKTAARSTAKKAKSTATTTRARSTATATARKAASSARTAPGATKAAVLGALSDGAGMTAGEVAAATGLARGTVSTTLSKLAKSGEVAKADRGYKLPSKSS